MDSFTQPDALATRQTAGTGLEVVQELSAISARVLFSLNVRPPKILLPARYRAQFSKEVERLLRLVFRL